MAGVDTARGINFQYAVAIKTLIAFLEHPEWAAIQLEGDVHIEDAVIRDAAAHVLLKIQIKQKSDGEAWEPHDLRDVLYDFSRSDDGSSPSYELVYTGAESTQFANKIKPLMEKIHHEGYESLQPDEIKELAVSMQKKRGKDHEDVGDDVVAFLARTDRRIRLVKQLPTEGLMAQDTLKLRKLMRHHGRQVGDDEETLYDRLFREVAITTEAGSRYKRELTRAEILDLLAIQADADTRQSVRLDHYMAWLQQYAGVAQQVVPLQIESKPVFGELTGHVVKMGGFRRGQRTPAKGEEQPRLVAEVVADVGSCVLLGVAGSGKTTILWELAREAAAAWLAAESSHRQGLPVPFFIDLGGYGGETVSQLLRQAFQASGELLSEAATDEWLAGQPALLLVDNMAALDVAQANEVARWLKRWLQLHPKVVAVIATERPTDARAIGLPTYEPKPLGDREIEQILGTLPGIDRRDILAIMNGFDDEHQVLVTTPLLLQMIAFLYARGLKQFPEHPGQIYKQVVAEVVDFTEAQIPRITPKRELLRLIGLLAAWMQDNQIEVITAGTLAGLIRAWVEGDPQLEVLREGGNQDGAVTRAELLRSGLLQIDPEGDVRFAHQAYRTYMAADTIQVGDLPRLVDAPHWHESLVMWAASGPILETEALLDPLLARPLLLGKVVVARASADLPRPPRRQADEDYFTELHRYGNTLLAAFGGLAQKPWECFPRRPRDLVVASPTGAGYILAWAPADQEPGRVVRVRDWSPSPSPDGRSIGASGWLLLPEPVMRAYHPIEVAYRWLMRALYDLLEFWSWSGATDSMRGGSERTERQVGSRLLARYQLYIGFAAALPEEIRATMPLYGDDRSDIVIAIDSSEDPPIVRLASVPARQLGEIRIEVQEPEDQEPMLEKSTSGEWIVRLDGRAVEPASVQEEELEDFLTKDPGVLAQKWIAEALADRLPGYPPGDW